MDIVSAAIILLLVMDPVGNIPLFLAVLKDIAPARQRYILFRELLISLTALVIFLFFGKNILSLFNLKESSISIAGGIILFLIAIKMIFPTKGSSMIDDQLQGEPFIVPLAIPLIAGPSAFATLLLLVSQEPERIFDWSIALAIAWLVTAVVLMASTALHRFLGVRGVIAIERLMGMLLVTVAVQMFLDGLAAYLSL
jgi:multiple antibiotic resistance protein